MLSSPVVSIVFTAVFVTTGGWALYRLATAASGADPEVQRPVELAHLLMSVAMLAMVWGWTGGPESASGIVQLVVFGLLSLWFLVGAVGGRLADGLHLVSTAAMVWMVTAMPQLMGGSGAADDMAGMAGMAGMTEPASGSASGSPSAVPTAAVAVTLVLAVLLVVAAGLWVRRGLRCDASSSARGATGGHAATVQVLGPVEVRRRTAARLDAGGHALMSAAMAGLLVTML